MTTDSPAAPSIPTINIADLAIPDFSNLGELQCEFCGKECASRGGLASHRERHVQLEKCEVCCKNFRDKYELANHLCEGPKKKKTYPKKKADKAAGGAKKKQKKTQEAQDPSESYENFE